MSDEQQQLMNDFYFDEKPGTETWKDGDHTVTLNQLRCTVDKAGVLQRIWVDFKEIAAPSASFPMQGMFAKADGAEIRSKEWCRDYAGLGAIQLDAKAAVPIQGDHTVKGTIGRVINDSGIFYNWGLNAWERTLTGDEDEPEIKIDSDVEETPTPS